MTRIIATSAAIGLAALLVGIWVLTGFRSSDDVFANCRISVIAGGAGQIGGPFTLVNSKGKTVTDKDVLTGPSLLYFGYTFCPDVCPFDLARNADAIDVLDENGYSVTPVFISIDPARDTPDVIGDYTYNMHERMIGLTGSLEQVKAASQAYKTFYKVHQADDEYYLVDHSTFSYLVLPEYGFVEFFRREVEPEDMAAKIGCFLDNA
ncbi:MAG: SCO family protein [Rhodobacteraceae bacterium]|nr:SCO family protein [Paracoccaceae bacterium]